MSKRLLLFVLLIALAGFAWWLNKNSENTTLKGPLSDFAIADTASVSRIFIVDQHGKKIDLKRTPSGWTLNDIFVPQTIRVELLLKTFKRVEVRSPVAKSAEENVLRVMGVGGKKVEIYQGGPVPTKIWIVGHATPDHFGTYMLLEKLGVGRSSSPFEMHMPGFIGVLNTRFNTEFDEWRSPSVFSYPEVFKLAEVKSEQPLRPNSSYKIEQDTNGDVHLYDGLGAPLPMDTALVKGALYAYKDLNYEYIDRRMKPSKRDSLLSATPNYIITTKDRTGNENKIKLWFMPYTGASPTFDISQPLNDAEHMYALVQDSLVTVVQRASFDAILQPAQAMRP